MFTVRLRCGYIDKVLGKEAHVPAIFNSGLNSGILFMRLDRMREFNFEEKMINLSVLYRDKLLYPEQDLLNILFHNNIGKLF